MFELDFSKHHTMERGLKYKKSVWEWKTATCTTNLTVAYSLTTRFRNLRHFTLWIVLFLCTTSSFSGYHKLETMLIVVSRRVCLSIRSQCNSYQQNSIVVYRRIFNLVPSCLLLLSCLYFSYLIKNIVALEMIAATFKREFNLRKYKAINTV